MRGFAKSFLAVIVLCSLLSPGIPCARAACFAYEDGLHALGSYNQLHYPRGMQYREPYLYLADSGDELTVMDVSDPAHMVPVGSLELAGSPADLEVSGSLGCLVLYSHVLQLVDLSDPHAPNPLGSAPIPSGPTAVAMAGSYAFVTATEYMGEDGLYIFDLADPSAPVFLDRVDVGFMPAAIEIDGSEAYVLSGDGLLVFDLSVPTAPVLIGSMPIPGEAHYLAFRGDYLYIVCQATGEKAPGKDGERYFGDGLYVVDRSDPSHPWITDSYAPPLSPPARGVALWDRYALVTDGLYGIGFYDISDPFDLRRVLAIGIQQYAEFFAVADDLLFSWGDRLVSYRLQEPLTPEPVARIEGTEQCMRIALREPYAFTGQLYGEDFLTLDLSDPTSPRVVASLRLPFSGVTAIAVTEEEGAAPYAYIGGNGNPDSIAVIDLSDPLQPQVVNILVFPHHTSDLEVEGRYLYSIEGALGVRILDLQDPVNPVEAATIPFTPSVQMLTVAGDRLYVGRRSSGMEHLFIYDVSDPYDPQPLGTSSLPEYPCEIEIDGPLAYIANDIEGVLILDVSDPATPTLVSRMETNARARDLALDGNLLYVTDGSPEGGLHVIEVSDPYAPEVIGYYHSDRAADLALVYGHALVTHTSSLMEIAPLDCSSAGAPPGPQASRPVRGLLWTAPNPVRDVCFIRFSTDRAGPAILALFDPAGRLVRLLHQGTLPGGVHSFLWDGRNDANRPVPSGVYQARVKTAAGTEGTRVIWLR